jgi:glycosyltransferase involved in cell wall biosynthesis
MKVLSCFWNLDLFPRYYPQFKNLAKMFDEFEIVYIQGKINPDWKLYFNFKKIKLNHYPSYLKWVVGKFTIGSFVGIDADIVYSLSGLWTQSYGQAISEFHNIPRVIRMRGDPIQVRKVNRHFVKSKLSDRYLYPSFRACTRIIPIVGKFKNVLKTMGVKEIDISDPISNGVDLNKFYYVEPPKDLNPAFIGRLSKEKNIDFLDMIIRRTDYQYIMTGSNQINYTPRDNTWYLGYTPYSEIQRVYKKAGVLLLPSLYEGLSNIILESYAMGRPIIGNFESIPDEIKIFGIKTENKIGNWIRALKGLEDPELRYKIGIQSRLYVTKNFSWDQYSQKMKAEIEKAHILYNKNQ